MVKLNKIYTKTGDQGTTGLGTGARVSKHDARITAYGTVDETNAAIGVARTELSDQQSELDQQLMRIQHDLFDLGADLCVPDTGEKLAFEPLRITDDQVARVERDLDAAQRKPGAIEVFYFAGRPSLGCCTSSGAYGVTPCGTRDDIACKRRWGSRKPCSVKIHQSTV